MGTYYLFPEETTPIDTFGGRSFIIDYKGQIVGRQDYGAGSTYVGGVIDIEALRDHRARAQWDNWMKDLRTELYQILYEQPIYPKNLYLERAPMKHAEYREKVIKPQIELMHDRDIWKRPAQIMIRLVRSCCWCCSRCRPRPRLQAAGRLHRPGLRDGRGLRHRRHARHPGHPGHLHLGVRSEPAPLPGAHGTALRRRRGLRPLAHLSDSRRRRARLSPDVESRYFYGPRSLNPQVGATRRGPRGSS